MNAPTSPSEFEPRQRLFTYSDVITMIENGVLREGVDRVELIDGRLFDLPSEGDDHWLTGSRLLMAFAEVYPPTELRSRGLAMSANSTLRISESRVLEPDFVVFEQPASMRPLGPDISRLVVECADTSLA